MLDESLLTALMAWEALGEYGVTYLADPVSPYAVLKSTQNLVLDTVQFPRNTLKLKSGDCDDLTALFASIYEASGLRVALLDFPGHIALMFDTGETEASAVGIPEEYLIKYNNTFWVGVETTMVGKSFYDAVVHAADLYRKMEKELKVIDVRAAWGEFEPVTLPEAEGDKYASPGLTARVREAIAALNAARYEHLKKYYGRILQEMPDDAETNISLGIVHAEYKAYAEAAGCFEKVLEKEPFNAGALNNIGNLRFTAGKYEEARDYYFKASKADPFDGGIWLNLARTAAKLGKKDDAKMFAERAARQGLERLVRQHAQGPEVQGAEAAGIQAARELGGRRARRQAGGGSQRPLLEGRRFREGPEKAGRRKGPAHRGRGAGGQRGRGRRPRRPE
jgi:tetratricopeptide (TPR) repeat protein